MNRRRVLITGGCGFVGANLIADLVRHGGWEIVVYDNESLGRREWLGEFDVTFVKGDLRDAAALDAALKGVELVVHLAADTRVIPSIENPIFNFEVNVGGTLNLLEAMRANGVSRLVNASTGGAIVGNAPPPVHERLPAAPASPYGASKLAVEGYCSAYCESYGMASASLRFSNVYGPRSYHKGSVIAHFLRRIQNGEDLVIYGDGSQTRDYVFVEDICAGVMRCLELGAVGVYQLGSGAPTTINELVELMREVTDVPFNVRHEEFRPGEVTATYSDISHARVALGFEPKIDLRNGLARTWEWFTKQQDAVGR